MGCAGTNLIHRGHTIDQIWLLSARDLLGDPTYLAPGREQAHQTCSGHKGVSDWSTWMPGPKVIQQNIALLQSNLYYSPQWLIHLMLWPVGGDIFRPEKTTETSSQESHMILLCNYFFSLQTIWLCGQILFTLSSLWRFLTHTLKFDHLTICCWYVDTADINTGVTFQKMR